MKLLYAFVLSGPVVVVWIPYQQLGQSWYLYVNLKRNYLFRTSLDSACNRIDNASGSSLHQAQSSCLQ